MEQLNLHYESATQSLRSSVGESEDDEEKCLNVCLFCSKQFNCHQDLQSIQLQTICKNLKINLEEIVNFIDAATGLALCEQCTSVSSKLSGLFEQLEVTQMWINHLLRTLMGILISGEGTNTVTQTPKDIEGYQILRELIMEKCNSTVKATNFPHLKLNRCQLPVRPIKQESEDEDDYEEAKVDLSCNSPINSSSSLDTIIKLEETDVTFNYNFTPNSPSPPPSPPPSPLPSPPPLQKFEKPISSLKFKKKFVKKVIKRKHKPFWFIKPTKEIFPQGKRKTKYICPFCPKSTHGFTACKFHVIGKHPEHIFPFQHLPHLTAQQFSTCCSTILEEEVTPISNEDGEGSYTTFECKYCEPEQIMRKADKRVVQVHQIRSHYNELVDKLKSFQELHGSQEFEEKLAKYSDKPSYSKRMGKGSEFKNKWRCDECQCGFPNKKRFEAHNIRMHGDLGGGGRVKLGDSEASSTVPKASPCETCGKVFSCGYSLWRHKRLSCVKILKKEMASRGKGHLGVGSEMGLEEREYLGRNDFGDEEVDQEILPNELEKDPLS